MQAGKERFEEKKSVENDGLAIVASRIERIESDGGTRWIYRDIRGWLGELESQFQKL